MLRTSSLRLAAGLGAGAALAALALPAAAAKDGVDLVSASSSGRTANGHSKDAAISFAGDRVVFTSKATNLSPSDRSSTEDVFLRRVSTGRTTLISRATGARGAGGGDHSFGADLSSDGRRVAFRSRADNLSRADDNKLTNIFVRDTRTRRTILVSRATGARGAAADGHSYELSLSGNGRYVAFASLADNLSAADDDTVRNIYVRDLKTGTTSLVSRASGIDGAGADRHSHAPSISRSGRYVAFASRADNLSPEDDDSVINIFVRDLVTHETILVSRKSGADGDGARNHTYRPSISGNGRRVAFDTSSSLEFTGTNASHVYIRDLRGNTTTLVSRAAGTDGEAGDDHSAWARLSHDGTKVVFSSLAENLLRAAGRDPDPLSTDHHYLRNLTTDTTTLVSAAAGPNGSQANGIVRKPVISGDGRFVAFDSESSNLAKTDGKRRYHIFRRDVAGPPPSALGGRP